MADLVVGIDLATSDVRATVCDAAGEVVAHAAVPMPTPRREGGRSLQQPAYWQSASEVLRAVTSSLGAAASGIGGLSVTGTSGSLVPCDRGGRPVGDASLYDDAVAVHEARVLSDAGVAVGPTSPLARLGWLHRHAPAPMYLHTPDVVASALLGELAPSDTSHALKAGIDPVAAAWDQALLALLGVPGDVVPELVHPGADLGVVADAVAADLGLPRGVRVVAGMTDGCTAQIATGVVEPGSSVGVLGTTLVLKAVSTEPIGGFGGTIYSHYAPDGRFWPGGASNVGAGVVSTEHPDADLGRLDAAAAAYGPASTVRYPLPGRGERFPFSAPDATGFTVGEPRDATDAYRALLEGVAFAERLGLETLGALGVESTDHRVAGGASVSPVWNRIRASVLNRPLARPDQPNSAFGAAVLAFATVSGTGLAATTRDMVRVVESVAPDTGEVERLDDSYHRLLAELTRRGLHPSPVAQRATAD